MIVHVIEASNKERFENKLQEFLRSLDGVYQIHYSTSSDGKYTEYSALIIY